jgi:FMN reductase
MTHPPDDSLIAIGISGSPRPHSRSRALVVCVLERLRAEGVRTSLVDLSAISADALLGRAPSLVLAKAIASVAAAQIVVAGTPVYRATYSGLLKVFFDALPSGALAGKVAVPVATGGGSAHEGVIDLGLRPLFASLDAVVAPAGIFAVDAQFTNGVPDETLAARARQAAVAAFHLAESLHATPVSSSTLGS